MGVKAAILFFSLCLPALADLAAGQQAFRNGEYATALKDLLPLAKQGNAVAQFFVGFMYDQGQGVAQDYIHAHTWFSLAGASGNADGIKYRDIVARKMTPDQIAEAQRLAREWKPKIELPR